MRDDKLRKRLEQVALSLVGKPVRVEFGAPRSRGVLGEAKLADDGSLAITILPTATDEQLKRLLIRGCAKLRVEADGEFAAFTTSSLATRMINMEPLLKRREREEMLVSKWMAYAHEYSNKNIGATQLERELTSLLLVAELRR